MANNRDSYRYIVLSEPQMKLIFYVDTECSLAGKERCSYYAAERVQKQAAHSAKQIWGSRCCPIVYVKRGRNKFTAYCPTRGGPWGEEVPVAGGPGPNAVRVEVQARSGESWAEIVEKAAKTACDAQCRN